MSEPKSPWARPDGVDGADGWSPSPSPSATGGAGTPVGASRPVAGAGTPVGGAGNASAGAVGWAARPADPSRYRTGPVTRPSASPPSDPGDEQPPADPARRQRRLMLLFGGAAAGVFVIGLVVVLTLVLTGHAPSRRTLTAPPDNRPPLAKLCPPPSGAPASGAPVPPPPPGPRTVDPDAGISYRAYGAPWQPWRQVWGKGTLGVVYRIGQDFVTEAYDGTGYYASILSGSVPTATNDALTLDLKCTGRQVAADVQAEYYPQPNTKDVIRDELTTLGGRPAWVSVFRLHFSVPDLKAKDELVGVALIDVGRPNAAVLYVSIPGTHRQYDYVVDDVVASVRPT
ncbi:MAG TPA: hypothetical protein VF054_00585 [Micromonosporaceae bacterium]